MLRDSPCCSVTVRPASGLPKSASFRAKAKLEAKSTAHTESLWPPLRRRRMPRSRRRPQPASPTRSRRRCWRHRLPLQALISIHRPCRHPSRPRVLEQAKRASQKKGHCQPFRAVQRHLQSASVPHLPVCESASPRPRMAMPRCGGLKAKGTKQRRRAKAATPQS